MASVNYLAAIGRYLIAALFLVSGFHKFLAPSETQALIASAGLPNSAAVYWAVASAEVFGGICLILGLLTRFAALILAFLSIGVAVLLHANFTDSTQTNLFLENLAVAGGLLQIVAFGPGGVVFRSRRPKK